MVRSRQVGGTGDLGRSPGWRYVLIKLIGLGVILGMILGALSVSPLSQVWGQGQLLAPLVGESPSVSAPISVFTTNGGQIDVATVELDGQPLFRVASLPLTTPDQPETLTLTANQRKRQIEASIQEILATGINLRRVDVTVGDLNNLTAILVSDQPRLQQELVVTVTEQDARLAQTSVSMLADQWATTLRGALIRAWEERRPEARQRQRITSIWIGLGLLFSSFLLSRLQRHLKEQFNAIEADPPQPTPESLGRPVKSPLAMINPLQLFGAIKPRLYLERRRNINILLRRLMRAGQICLWLFGLIAILYQFPETRTPSLSILTLPVRVIGIWLVVNLASKATDVVIDAYIQEWVENGYLFPSDDSKRVALRAPTIAAALKGISNVGAYVLGILWLLILQDIPLGSLVTGAGLLGAVLTFVFQSLIKDVVNGSLILLEDQYAVGDWVSIEGQLGLVEYVNLRITQVRGKRGRLITIPNSQISTVHNLTKNWARIDVIVDVSLDADTSLAMRVMREVGETMQQEEEWHDAIIDPANLLGVTGLSHCGIEITLWMKTKPMQQWVVEREYLRRLKLAFDAHGVQLGIPRQSLTIQNDRPQDTAPQKIMPQSTFRR